MMSDLLPCPFCGSTAKQQKDDLEYYWVVCKTCGASVSGSTLQRAKVAWNNRRTNGFENWLEGEMQKLPDVQIRNTTEQVKYLTYKRCQKQLRKLLKGMGVQ